METVGLSSYTSLIRVLATPPLHLHAVGRYPASYARGACWWTDGPRSDPGVVTWRGEGIRFFICEGGEDVHVVEMNSSIEELQRLSKVRYSLSIAPVHSHFLTASRCRIISTESFQLGDFHKFVR